MPVPVSSISTDNHKVVVGLSDAYYYDEYIMKGIVQCSRLHSELLRSYFSVYTVVHKNATLFHITATSTLCPPK